MENAKHCRCASRLLQDCRGILHQHNWDKYCWCYFCASTQPIGVAGSIMFLGCLSICAHTHTFNGPLSGTTRVSQYRKGKTNLDFTEARDSEWQWHQLGHTCKSAPCSKQIPRHHPTTQFFTGMPFLPPNQQCQCTKGKSVCLSVHACIKRVCVCPGGGNSWTACRRLLVLSISLLAELFDLERLSIFCAWDRERTNAVINFSSFAELIFGSQINDDALN